MKDQTVLHFWSDEVPDPSESKGGNSEKSRHCDQQELEAEALQACLQLMAAHLGKFESDHQCRSSISSLISPFVGHVISGHRWPKHDAFSLEGMQKMLSSEIPSWSRPWRNCCPTSRQSFQAIRCSQRPPLSLFDIGIIWDYIGIIIFLADVCTRKWWVT